MKRFTNSHPSGWNEVELKIIRIEGFLSLDTRRWVPSYTDENLDSILGFHLHNLISASASLSFDFKLEQLNYIQWWNWEFSEVGHQL